MKVEDCIVSVERRNLGGCLDLAFVFARQFAAPLSLLTLCFAVPSTVLVWLVADAVRHDVLIPCVMVFAVFNMLFSGAVVTTVGPQVFGVPISTSAAVKGLLSRIVSYAFLGILARMTGFCMFLPLLFVMAWCGHLPEVMFLERTPLNQVTQRLSWLGKGGGYSRNLSRIVSLMTFAAILSVGIFMIIDMVAGLVFHAPIFYGSIGAGPDRWEALQSKLIDAPAFVTAFQVALWIVSPIIRVAWFFCYLDQRIRNECWDLELQYRVESGRIEEQMA